VIKKKVVLSVLSTAVVTSMAASALAAPKAGIYIGGEVDKYYSFNSLTNSSNVDKLIDDLIDTSANGVFVNEEGVGGYLVDLLFAENPEEQFETVTNDFFAQIGGEDGFYTVNEDGTVSDTKEPADPDNPVNGELKVESVSAIDNQTVEVVFSGEVDDASAETVANYVLSKQVTPPVAPVTPTSAVLATDNKTVTLTFAANTLAPNTTHKLYISNIRKKDDLDVVVPTVEKQIVISDEAPAVVSARVVGTSGGNTTVDVTFNQELESEGTFSGYVAKTAGETDKAATAATVLSDNKTVRLTFPALTAGNQYTIELPDDIENKFGKLVAADATVTVAAVADTTAPTVVSVMQDAEESDASNQVLKIKFSEPVDATTLTGEVFASDLSHQAVTFDAVDGDTVTVLVPDTFELKAGQTYTLKITQSNVADKSGNPLAVPISKTFTAIDKVAPIAQKVTKVDEKTVKIEFNETVSIEEGTTFEVDNVAATASASGNTITLTTTNSFGTDDVSALEINGAVKDAAGNETAYAGDIMGSVSDNVDAAAPVVASTTASGTTITLTFSEALATISGIDTDAEVAEVLTVTKADGTAVTATTLANNGTDLEITVPAVNAGDVFYVKFKSGQTVVADSDNNKYTNTKSIKVVAQ
jgi:hypothetical protein